MQGLNAPTAVCGVVLSRPREEERMAEVTTRRRGRLTNASLGGAAGRGGGGHSGARRDGF